MLPCSDKIDWCTISSNYTTEFRREFIIKETPQKICSLLKNLSNEGILIDGYSLQSLSSKCSICRFVVGTEATQSVEDLKKTKSILCKLSIEYLEDKILRVIPIIPTTLDAAELYCELKNIIKFNASYFARNEGIYIQLSTIC